LQRRGFVDRPEIDVAADIQRADAEVSRVENARVDADAFFCPVRRRRWWWRRPIARSGIRNRILGF
jgi:hypothetical protein